MLVLRIWNLADRQNIESVVICLFVAEILAVTHELHLDDISEEILHDGHILILWVCLLANQLALAVDLEFQHFIFRVKNQLSDSTLDEARLCRVNVIWVA